MQVSVVVHLAVWLAVAADDHAPSLRGSASLSSDLLGKRNRSEEIEKTSPQPPAVAELALAAGTEGAHMLNETSVLPEGDFSEEVLQPHVLLSSSGGWYQGGDKMWGGGSGLESINSGNVGYYDQGMYAAHARCGGSGCALIVNPPGHRTVNQFHIHFVHYEGYGSSLKQKLEGEVCGKSGWHGGGLPCGGKAAFFSGFPAVFSEAMTAGGFAHASVIAWPASCGGSGTIVELAYGCSIEHQIRGDYDPRYR